MRTPEEYLELPYTISLVRDAWEDGTTGWFAEVDELPGCMSQGRTPDEAVARVRDAMLGWISVALEDGTDVPEPRGTATHSGRFLLRLPRGLHAELARAADREGTSLNQFASAALAGAVGWRAARPTPPSEGGRVQLRNWVETEPVETQVELRQQTSSAEREAIDPRLGAIRAEEEIEVPLRGEQTVAETPTGRKRVSVERGTEFETDAAREPLREDRTEIDRDD